MTYDAELVNHRLKRARETLDEAGLMGESDHWNGCVNRLYYACFYAVSALLLTKGLSSPKHTGVRGLFSIHFVRTGLFPKDLASFYNTLFDARQESDYEDYFLADPEEVREWIPLAEQFLDVVSGLVSHQG